MRSMMPWTSSGSSRSDIAVNPDTSLKTTVTCLRSPTIAAFEVRILSARCLGVYACGLANLVWLAGAPAAVRVGAGAAVPAAAGAAPSPPGACAPSRAPQVLQNLFAGGLTAPQDRQTGDSRAPQSPQNAA